MKNPVKAGETLNGVFELVNELDSENIKASAHLLSGRLATDENRWDDAIASFDISLLLFKKANMQVSIGAVYYYRGLMFTEMADESGALDSFGKALEIFEKIGAIGWIDKTNAARKATLLSP
jgi:tetratricopeptide (TPR) repeat protein